MTVRVPSLRTLYRQVAAVEDTDYTGVQAVVCLTSGNCVIRDQNGTDITYAMTAGQVLYFAAVSIRAASTGTYALWF
jgi:hypothetical protein